MEKVTYEINGKEYDGNAAIEPQRKERRKGEDDRRKKEDRRKSA